MTLIEAAKSGKAIKRKCWSSWRHKKSRGYYSTHYMSDEDIFADDWKIEKTPEVYEVECVWCITTGPYGILHPINFKGLVLPENVDIVTQLVGRRTKLRIEVIE